MSNAADDARAENDDPIADWSREELERQYRKCVAARNGLRTLHNQARDEADDLRRQLDGAVSALCEAHAHIAAWSPHPDHQTRTLLARIDATLPQQSMSEERDHLSVMKRRDGSDRPEWANIELRVCGDCGWYSTDKRVCPGCGVEGVPITYTRRAVDRAEKAEAELAKIESILVAADRVREAYEAMLDGRKLGRLPDFEGGRR